MTHLAADFYLPYTNTFSTIIYTVEKMLKSMGQVLVRVTALIYGSADSPMLCYSNSHERVANSISVFPLPSTRAPPFFLVMKWFDKNVQRKFTLM